MPLYYVSIIQNIMEVSHAPVGNINYTDIVRKFKEIKTNFFVKYYYYYEN